MSQVHTSKQGQGSALWSTLGSPEGISWAGTQHSQAASCLLAMLVHVLLQVNASFKHCQSAR